MSERERIVVAMSGGVDSSVAAALLQQQGYDVVGLFMNNGISHKGLVAANKQGCCSLDDSMDARAVASRLGVPFFALNFSTEFSRIIEYFLDEYEAGRTPNPCVQCNRWLKFGRLLDYADSIGARRVATGHYARIVARDGRLAVGRGCDAAKDQSYVLFPLEQSQLERTLLPLGELTKDEVRRLAGEFGLSVQQKPDSQEICFVPDNRYATLIEERRPGSITPGPLVDRSGQLLGEHPGHQLFTIGQRKGLGVTFGKPKYVVETIAATNTVVIGDEDDLEARALILGDVVFSGIAGISRGMDVYGQVKIRYRHEPVPAVAHVDEQDRVVVQFQNPIKAVTPGQAAVFYADDLVLFGGFIVAPLRHIP